MNTNVQIMQFSKKKKKIPPKVDSMKHTCSN